MSPRLKRQSSRTVATLAVGFGLLVCLVWHFILSEPTPVYCGKSAAYWFPKWVPPGATSPSHWPEDAGPDAIPFLLNHLKGMGKSMDLYEEDWLASNWEKLPDSIIRRLPQPIALGDRADLTISAIADILDDYPESVRELATALPEFSDYAKGKLIWILPTESPELNALRLDLIRMALKGPSPELRDSAMTWVLYTAEEFVACLPEILHAAAAYEAEGNPMRTSWNPLLFAELGEIAAPLLPFLEKERNSETSEFKISPAIALARIRGGDEAMLALLDSSIVAQGWDAVDGYLTTISALSNPSPRTLLPFWINLASERGASDLISRLPIHPTDPTNLVSKVRTRALNRLLPINGDPSPSTEVLLEALHSSDSDVLVEALKTLLRFDPPPEAALPRLIQLLPNGSYRGYIVELLGKYGNRATNAIPILSALAEGRYPDELTDRKESPPMVQSPNEVPNRISRAARQALDAIENGP